MRNDVYRNHIRSSFFDENRTSNQVIMLIFGDRAQLTTLSAGLLGEMPHDAQKFYFETRFQGTYDPDALSAVNGLRRFNINRIVDAVYSQKEIQERLEENNVPRGVVLPRTKLEIPNGNWNYKRTNSENKRLNTQLNLWLAEQNRTWDYDDPDIEEEVGIVGVPQGYFPAKTKISNEGEVFYYYTEGEQRGPTVQILDILTCPVTVDQYGTTTAHLSLKDAITQVIPGLKRKGHLVTHGGLGIHEDAIGPACYLNWEIKGNDSYLAFCGSAFTADRTSKARDLMDLIATRARTLDLEPEFNEAQFAPNHYVLPEKSPKKQYSDDYFPF